MWSRTPYYRKYFIIIINVKMGKIQLAISNLPHIHLPIKNVRPRARQLNIIFVITVGIINFAQQKVATISLLHVCVFAVLTVVVRKVISGHVSGRAPPPPSMRDTLTQWRFNVGPHSKTVAQHWTVIGSTYRLSWGRQFTEVSTWQPSEHPMLVLCWTGVVYGGPTIYQQWPNVFCIIDVNYS